jgi:hypothetical protein
MVVLLSTSVDKFLELCLFKGHTLQKGVTVLQKGNIPLNLY